MRRSNALGFTIIEMMVVVAIVTVLASVAAPNLSQLLAARQAEDVARHVSEDVAFGRSEAVKRNAPVLFCARSSGACAAAPATGDWAQGWRVCYDLNADGSCDATGASDPNPMRSRSATATNLQFTGPLSGLRFNPDGTITSADLTEFTVLGAGTPGVRWIVRIAASGAVSVRKG